MTTSPTLTHASCAHCGAPVDERQRHCIECGTSRRHPDDPVMRHATLVARRAAAAAEPAQPPASRGADGRVTALVLALLPAAAALGVIVGRHGGSGSDERLLAALRAQPAAASATSAGSAAAPTVTSDFSLGTGYVVELRTLPAGSSASAVAAAERAARANGAKGVGIIDPTDFRLKPSSHGAYVLYAGQFRSRAAARRALAKLRGHFPRAVIVQVGSPLGGHDKAARIAAEDAVVRKHPTAQQKQQGARIVQQIQAKRGKSYVKQQQQLPDTIVVP